eukprot:TRINITY_DN3738_c0_g1_i6.p1 TRINITY_DN3738_c0_g1~~TRINITY_DN3738_c0_g1_i6.p1  ORF type:complete len:308 (+),score=70.36 TRINITY_DN3738_c0_g1_i6:671-1594(+)
MGFEELWDGFQDVTQRTLDGELFTKDVIKYFEKRLAVEQRYQKELAHLQSVFATVHEIGTTQTCWLGLRDETLALSKDRDNICGQILNLLTDVKSQLNEDRRKRAELLAKGNKLCKDLAVTEDVHKKARMKYVESRRQQQKTDDALKKAKAQGAKTTKLEKALGKEKQKAQKADEEYKNTVIQLATHQDKFHLEDMPALMKEFEHHEMGRLTQTKKHFEQFTWIQSIVGPTTIESTNRLKSKVESLDVKSDLESYVNQHRPPPDVPPPRAQYMSWDGTIVEDVGPSRSKSFAVVFLHFHLLVMIDFQ